jgi:hypothetical protein
MNFFTPVPTKQVGLFVRSTSTKAFSDYLKASKESGTEANAILVADAVVGADGKQLFQSPEEAMSSLPIALFIELLEQIKVESGMAVPASEEKNDLTEEKSSSVS